jgi:hypothetical protein
MNHRQLITLTGEAASPDSTRMWLEVDDLDCGN